MKEINKKLLAGVLATLTLAASALTSVANAEVAGSVGAANMYYWRGLDLGNGDAAIWGDINVSGGGAYAGMWASSGDATFGTEYDLYVGYGHEFGDFGFDISYWTYSYPSTAPTPAVYDEVTGDLVTPQIENTTAPGDLAEIVLALSYGPVELTYYDNVEGADDYSYITLGVSVGDFSFKYGEHADTEGTANDGYSHFDITYAFNENLSFTLGTVVDNTEDIDGNLFYRDDEKFVVNLSLPIE